MKIFNWVHRRFHHNVLKEEFARDVKKAKSNDKESQTMLEQIALVEVLDGWKDGILTIGTFGFDPLKLPFHDKVQKEYQNSYQEIDQDEEDEEEEEYSVTSEEYGHDPEQNVDNGFEDDDDDDDDDDQEDEPLVFTKLNMMMSPNIDAHVSRNNSAAELLPEPTPFSSEITEDYSSDQMDQKKKKGERTTLADLFLADSNLHVNDDNCTFNSEDEMVNQQEQQQLNSSTKRQAATQTKTTLSFAKKLIPQVGEKSRPIKKLNQMMRRMLKRKIHPEFDQGNKAAACKNMDGLELESASLLPISDVIA